ncbi:hypothetical protein GHT09_014529 [Marmota monax]|uniref:acetyl-CoA C-acetyltransferase n=1 Tax=Marmota monax TaxID=9995 RepID=A0A834QCB7_MARMO|nr:hypothetical protein GHT09_014529 [Marmota monax]
MGRAAREQRKGCFHAEIVPVTTTIHDDKGTKRSITVSQDEGICPNTTMEGLAKLKPAFKDGGSPTAANTSNGAGAVLLARRSKAEELGLPILGVLRSYAVVGVPPDVMGIGPAYAIPEALEKAGLTLNDVDIFEINEAIVSQAVYCVEKLEIPPEKVNPLGGAVALGHPLGCTGARQVITLLNELKRGGKRPSKVWLRPWTSSACWDPDKSRLPDEQPRSATTWTFILHMLPHPLSVPRTFVVQGQPCLPSGVKS